MSFSATAVRILIASPGDVDAERDAAESEINDWNALNATAFGLVLLPVRWETHTTPETGSHPQVVINRQILRDVDFVIGIFRNRLGTPTPTHLSGTVEEITLHMGAGGAAKLYFSTETLPRNHDVEQFKALERYREQMKQQALYASFSSLEDFKNQLRRHLTMEMNHFRDRSGSTAALASQATALTLTEKAKYLLIAMAASPDRRLRHMHAVQGESIIAGEVSILTTTATPHERSVQAEALSSLQRLGLIFPVTEDPGYFEVTQHGFETADELNKQTRLHLELRVSTSLHGETRLSIKANKCIELEKVLFQTHSGATVANQPIEKKAVSTSILFRYDTLLTLWNSNREGMRADRSGPAKLALVIKDGTEVKTVTVQTQLSPLAVYKNPSSLVST